MFRAFSNISSDAAVATRHLLSGVFLLSGFNVCIAAGAFVAGVVAQGRGDAFKNFLTVMNYSGIEIVSPIPEMIAAFNWTTLGAIGIFAAYTTLNYLKEAALRPAVTSNVILFPKKSIEAAAQIEPKIVVNG